MRWLGAVGLGAAGPECSVEWLSGDVSPRRYYRVRSGDDSAIVAFYPPELRPVGRRFQRTSELLAAAGVRVPAIRRFDEDAGLMMLEDLGTETLFDWRGRPWDALSPSLEAALAAARRVARIDVGALAELLPPLDAVGLERELGVTWDVFLVPQGLTGDETLRRRLRARLEVLCAELEAEGLVPCHRDFMARNLVPVPATGEIAVLDHQDLRLGPRSYDVASLFNDSLFPPERVVRELAGDEIWRSAGYHRAVVQRTLKIVGTFVSFARRGEPRYLPMVPMSLARCLESLAALPDDGGLASDLRRTW
ncbi:MAG TPA: phosphotransferase, partial [Thermoanaerobaculia bacterium]|nr:phosphotransferase [Thermoanaerobaculia bacterium]